jgi:hypothetical protein
MEKRWIELSPEQKRDERFKLWLSPANIKFNSTEAEKDYKSRVTRIIDAVLLREPDRVPVELPVGFFPAYYAGTNLQKVMYDYDELRRAWLKFLEDFDMDMYSSPYLVFPGKVMEILGHKLHKWPGHGLGPDVSSYQFVEGEYMRADEYDALIKDPSDFALRVRLPRVLETLRPFEKLSRVSSILGSPLGFVNAFGRPEVQSALLALVEAGKESARWLEGVRYCGRRALEAGVPSVSGGSGVAPFDRIGDYLRGTQGIIMDMYRQPDKLLEAMEILTPLIVDEAVSAANASGGAFVFFPLHKGADGFMSDKQFDTFYWPTLKKIILALIDEGLTSVLSAQGSYMTRLEAVKDLPRGWVWWRLHQTDIATAKKVLGNNACISGNVPSSLLYAGSAQEVKEYCRKLIEIAGKDGGYILSAGAAVEKTNPDNLRAMMDAAKEYGVYRK